MTMSILWILTNYVAEATTPKTSRSTLPLGKGRGHFAQHKDLVRLYFFVFAARHNENFPCIADPFEELDGQVEKQVQQRPQALLLLTHCGIRGCEAERQSHIQLLKDDDELLSPFSAD